MDDGPSRTPFSELLLAVFNSILEVFILCLSGYILARRGIFDKKTQKQLNRLNVTLFTPALLFSKVAYFLSPEKLKELWIIPIWFTLVTMASMLVGRVLGALFHLRRSQRSFVMAAAMFMNSNSLPIALMQSLVISVPDLAWGKTDSSNAMIGRALTYLTMYSTLGMVIRYSYGVNLLSRSDSVNIPPTGSESDDNEADERTPLLLPSKGLMASSASLPRLQAHSRAASISQQKSSPATNASLLQPTVVFTSNQNGILAESNTMTQPQPHFQREALFYNSFPNTPRDSVLTLAHYDSRVDSETDDELLQLPTSGGVEGSLMQHSPVQRRVHRLQKSIGRMWIAIKKFMTAPLWAALLSLVVAFIDPLKHALEHHMQPVNGAINTAGKCAIPLTLVVLGAYFHDPQIDSDDATTSCTQKTGEVDATTWQRFTRLFRTRPLETSMASDIPKHPGETKTVVLAVLARMVITPILLVPFLMMAARFNWQAVFDDPVFVTVNTILLCSPPAVTLAQITAAVSGNAYERLISRTIFWSYCCVTPPVTIGCVLLGLWLSKI